MFGRFREMYQKVMAPVGSALLKTGITPNTMTVLTLLPAIVGCYSYIIAQPVLSALLIVVMGVLDMMDGAIARAADRETRFGATLDHVIDRYTEFFIIFGMIFGSYTYWASGLFALFGMLMASFTRAKAESVGGLKSCTVGIAERQEKLLLLIAGSVLAKVFPIILNYAVILVGILSHVTVLQRLRYTWVQSGGK